MHGDLIAYLPLAHIAERELGIYGALSKAAHVTTCADPDQVAGALAKVRPVLFFGVPRVWEKMAAALQGVVAASDEQKRAAFAEAHGLGLRAYRLRAAGQQVPDDLAAQRDQLDALVLRPIRAMIGLDNLKWAASGAAPIPVAVLEFFGGLGIDILEVWGMSETTGSATASTPEAFRPGKVGRTIPGVEVRLAEDGESLVRGPVVFLGYLQADGSVMSTVDSEGWLATGDIGVLDEEGFLTITDRKKELIITSSGKNIAPTKLEGLLRAHPMVGNAIVIGDRRPYVTALVTLEDGVDGAGAQDELDELVASVNSQLSRPEQIKKYLVLPTPWTPEGGELTPTLKLRRRVVHERYAEAIEGLYKQ
jgi:long-chain acyl-CoA synthetase